MNSDLDIAKLKAIVIQTWQCGGMDTLVKVMPFGQRPERWKAIGYCTLLKFVAGRTPAQIESSVGLGAGTKLARGAEVFKVVPLPAPDEFDLKGYSQTPAGVPIYNGSIIDPHYPPGLGVPQWDLARVFQSRLIHLASVPPGQLVSYRLK